MKKMHLILLLTLFIMAPLQAQRKPKIKGSRQVVEESGSLDYFNRVVVSEDVPLRLVRGRAPGFTIRADDNLVDVFRFRVTDSVLHVASFYRVTASKRLEIEVQFPELTQLRVEGSRVSVTCLDGEAIQLELGEGGEVEGELGASYLTLDLLADSRATLSLSSDTLLLAQADQSRADLDLLQVGQVRMSLDGSTQTRAGGQADSLSVSLTGNAGLDASDLAVPVAELVARDRTRASIRAQEALYLDSQDQAAVRFYGNGRLEVSQFSGRSQLRKEDN